MVDLIERGGREPGLALLQVRIRATIRRRYAWAVGLLVIGLGLPATMAVALREQASGDFLGGVIVTAVIGLPFALLGGWVARGARRLSPPQASRVYREIASNGEAIKWAYVSVGDVRALHVCFVDGERLEISAKRSDANALLALVETSVPGAMIGYSLDKSVDYQALVDAHLQAAKAGFASAPP